MSLIQESSENYKREKRDVVLMALGSVAVLFSAIGMMVMAGGLAAVNNFFDIPILTYMTIIFILVLALGGMLKDFIKAFSIAIITDKTQSTGQIQKCMTAIKTAMITVNVAGILNFIIGAVVSLGTWAGRGYEIDSLMVWIAVALLSIVYALVATLILLPIYMRLKNKKIEE